MVTKVKNNFEYSVPGKWILAGEHAVLRGSQALVFPLSSKYLRFSYSENAEDFKLTTSGTHKTELDMFIWSVIERYLDMLSLKRSDLKGHLEIQSEIQFGAGMGASATLAVGLSQFFSQVGFLKSDLFDFSKKIEDLFHGESSGVDVAVALYQSPLIFKRGEPIQILKKYDLPQLCISYSGTRGVTKDCVDKVKELLHNDFDKYNLIDAQMAAVVQQFIKVLQNPPNDVTWAQLLERAQNCFVEWGLVPHEAEKHIEQLRTSGALACKMTGSGGGGYILSLWPQKADLNELNSTLRNQLIRIKSPAESSK